MDIALIPETAPFSSEQRAWLNGFFAGWLGLQPPGTPPPPGLIPPAVVATPEAPAEPWHDPTLPLEERMAMADGLPAPARLMAAMAQLDCGACGYVCRTYAEALSKGDESRATLCAPGGSETAKALKGLLRNAPAVAKAAPATAAIAPGDWSRDHPYPARVVRSVRLNRPGSEKETRHVEIDLGDDGPRYAAGDALGVYPENCAGLVDELLEALGSRGDERVFGPDGAETTLAATLTRDRCLTELTPTLFTRLAGAARDSSEAHTLRGLLDDDAPTEGFDVLDLLRHFPSARGIEPAAFADALAPIRPRLYSISSAPARHAPHVHLTVRRVTYDLRGRGRKGVASTMLADRVGPGSALRVFVQKSHAFSLPTDPDAPVIMVGPGTGVAPFRAFLHERDATGARGRNWLFFGEQRRSHDFLYETEFTEFQRRGVLTHLDTAFSRDGDEKVYVQQRLAESGAELYRWLEEGAYFYVCGDARRMAADVDRTLREVVKAHGNKSEEEARGYLARLSTLGRYCRDVY